MLSTPRMLQNLSYVSKRRDTLFPYQGDKTCVPHDFLLCVVYNHAHGYFVVGGYEGAGIRW